MRSYYAKEYAYGLGVLNNGQRADKVHAFPTMRERDTWVMSFAGGRDDPGFRLAVGHWNCSVRRARRHGTIIEHGTVIS